MEISFTPIDSHLKGMCANDVTDDFQLSLCLSFKTSDEAEPSDQHPLRYESIPLPPYIRDEMCEQSLKKLSINFVHDKNSYQFESTKQ